MGTTITENTDNHVEDVEHDLDNQTDEGPVAKDFPPLFEDETEALTEEELTGDEKAPESEEEAAAPPSEGDETPPEEKAPEDEKGEEEELPKDDPKEDGKPPEGYVPLAALHEERGKRQYLATEVETLKAEMADLKAAPKEPQADAFTVLSDQEFEDLLEEDPTKAILYDRQLRSHEAAETRKQDVQRADQAIIDRSTRAMREAVPQIYDPDSTLNNDLSKFAVEQGFDEQYLPVLTDPRTKVIPPGSDEPVLLGDVAVGQVKMLYNLFQQRSNNSDRAAIEKEVTARVTKDVTDTVTKQIMAKFKATPAQEYRSLGDLSGSGEEPFDVSKTLTNAQVEKLSESQRRQYLGG